MNKHIPTAAAALALVCAMGFSYAQSTNQNDSSTVPAQQTDPASPAPQDNAVPPPDQPASSSTYNTQQTTPPDSTSHNSTSSTNDNSGMASDSTTPQSQYDTTTQRAPQADRN